MDLAPVAGSAVLGHRGGAAEAGTSPVTSREIVADRRRRVVSAAAGLLAGAWLLAYVAGGRGVWVWIGQLAEIAAAVATTVVAATVVRRPARAARPVWFVAGAALSWAIARFVHVVDHDGMTVGKPVASVALLAATTSHVLLIAAFLAVPVQPRTTERRRTLDVLAIVAAATSVAWSLLAGIRAVGTDHDLPMLIHPASPLVWVLLLAAAGSASVRTVVGWRGPVVVGAAAVVVHVAADVADWIATELGGSAQPRATQSGWLVGWLMLCLAMTWDWERRPIAGHGRVPRTKLLPPVALGVAVAVLLAVELAVGGVREDPVLLVLTVGLFAIAIVRSVRFQFDSATLARALSEQAQNARVRLERYEDALEWSGTGVWEWDVGGGDVRVSRGLAWTLPGALSTSDDTVTDFLGSIDESDRATLVAAFERALADGAEIRLDRRVDSPDGDPRFVELRGRVRYGPAGEVTGISGVSIDVTERRRAERISAAHAARSAELAEFGRRTLRNEGVDRVADDAVEVLVRVLGADRCSIVRFDPVGHRHVVASADRPSGDPLPRPAPTASELRATIGTERGGWGLIELERSRPGGFDGGESDFVDSIASMVGHAIDRVEAQTQLRHHALHDRLTGLPNRTLLVDRLGQLVRDAVPRGRCVAVVYLGLDDFSRVNDSLGHEMGDEALVEVGRRLASVCPQGGTVARADGDEFVLAAPLGDPADAAALADSVLVRLRRPYELDGHEVHLMASVGVSVATDATQTPDRLLVGAASASHRAAERGGRGFEVFDLDVRERLLERVQLEEQIRRGLRAGEFHPWYQPIVDVSDGRIVGAEALVRWHHPMRGVLAPGDFAAVVERAGLWTDLGDAVIAAAFDDAMQWVGPDGEAPGVSVNLAATQLADEQVVDTLRRELDRTGIDPARVCVEIVEGMIPDDVTAQVQHAMEQIKSLGGVRISIDDFGTGHSSLSRLHSLPVDTLKIDRSFVAKLATSDHDRSLVAAIVQMAGALGIDTVAEGVETREQWEALQRLGCRYAQGWYFARAMPNDELMDRLALAPSAVTR